METALSNVSRILPVITTAHAPSAGNNTYWPELYFNQSMFDAEHFGPYRDSPAPRVFGMTSSLDPALFLSINEYTENLLSGTSSGKYSPIEVAQWIEDYATAGRRALAQAESSANGRGTAAYKRAKVDIQIQAGIGEFFGQSSVQAPSSTSTRSPMIQLPLKRRLRSTRWRGGHGPSPPTSVKAYI